jgi:hypothetical protein
MVEVEVTEAAYRALLSLVMDSVIVPPKRTATGIIARFDERNLALWEARLLPGESLSAGIVRLIQEAADRSPR